MYLYITAVSFLLLVAAATSLLCALYAWKRRPVPGSVAFAVFMLAVALWVLAYLLQLVNDDPAVKLAWIKLQYIGLSFVPVAWLVFSLRYTQRQAWLTSGRWALLLSMPLLTLLFVLTNDLHQLVWVQVNMVTAADLSYMSMVPGIWYWLFILFLYGSFLAGSLLLLTSTRYEIASLIPQQAFLLIAGLALPWFGAVFYIMDMSVINLTSLTFVLCGVAVAKYPLNFRFMKRTPLENQMVLNSLDDGVLVLDRAQTIVDANPAFIKIIKRPLSTILGCNLREILPEVAAKYDELKEKSVDIGCTGKTSTFCYELKRFPLPDWRKFISTEMIIFHDISERRRQEILRDDLLHAMVHDLRSPLSNSLFALEMLKRGTGQDNEADNQRLIALTYENNEKVLQLVNTILDVGQLEDDTIPVRLTAVPLTKLVDRVLVNQSPRAAAKNLTLISEIAPDCPIVWADDRLLERVVQNLVDNSIKYSPIEGTVKVTAVLINQQDKKRRQIHVTVSDEGPGLPPHLAQTAFDKFVTGPNKESGNGLGLAFCQMALAAHNQKIWVETPVGKGAAFTFSLALPPQLPEDIAVEDEWPDTLATPTAPSPLLSQALPN